jgi:hypothetical protein
MYKEDDTADSFVWVNAYFIVYYRHHMTDQIIGRWTQNSKHLASLCSSWAGNVIKTGIQSISVVRHTEQLKSFERTDIIIISSSFILDCFRIIVR